MSSRDTGEEPLGEATAVEPAKEHTVPSLAQRIEGVFLDPVATFRSLDSSWGLLGPWLVVAAAGLLYAVVAIAQVDFAAIADQRTQYEQTFWSDQQRRLLAQQEQTMNVGKLGSFMSRIGLLVSPTVGTILAIVAVGLVVFGGSIALGGKKDLLRSIVCAAHAKLVAIAGYAVLLVATVLGNPAPATSLKNVADEVASPLHAAALSILDPIAIWHVVLIAIALSVSLGVKPIRAAYFATALHVVPWLGGMGLAALSLMQRR